MEDVGEGGLASGGGSLVIAVAGQVGVGLAVAATVAVARSLLRSWCQRTFIFSQRCSLSSGNEPFSGGRACEALPPCGGGGERWASVVGGGGGGGGERWPRLLAMAIH